jgi:antitoxin component YwqK of YwqJK toxin-antitoxin module
MYLKYILITAFFLLILKPFVFAQNSDSTSLTNGIYRIKYLNGNTKEKGKYYQSKKQGVWYYYSENGVVLKKEKYNSGVLKWQLFFDKGKITQTIDKNGKVIKRPNCGC